MDGELPGFQSCHRIEAARLLQKFAGLEVQAFISGINTPTPTRRQRRDSRRADRRIQSELAEIVQEKTDNGRKIIDFLLSAMEGNLQDFKPCHRISASKELLHRGFDPIPEAQGIEEAETSSSVRPEPVEGPEEREARLSEEDYQRLRKETVEYSLHGPIYYDMYPWPCPCEDRKHDCKGNELSEEESEQAFRKSPARELFIHSDDKLEAFKGRYLEYLIRLNPDNPGVHDFFNNIQWDADDP